MPTYKMLALAFLFSTASLSLVKASSEQSSAVRDCSSGSCGENACSKHKHRSFCKQCPHDAACEEECESCQ